MKPTIYLGGPMSGMTWRQAMEWRWTAQTRLEHSWRLINPCRTQIPMDKLDEVIIASTQKDGDLDLHLTATGITAQDEFFIDQSDWLLVNFLGAERVSIGTVWEMGYAWAKGKKIVTVVEPGSINDHPFTRRRSHVFTPDFEEALDFFLVVAV